MIPFYIALLFLAAIGSKVFSKFCSNLIVGASAASYAMYFMVNGVLACIFFYISGGFRLSLNLTTTLYALVFAGVVVISTASLMAYKLTDVTTVTILTSTCGLIGTSFLGAFLFRENLSFTAILRIFIMLAATLLTFCDNHKRKDKPSKDAPADPSKKGLLLLLIVAGVMTLSTCASTIITKYFAIDPRVTDENSFFFFTNVFLIGFAAIVFGAESLRNREHGRIALQILHPKKVFSLVGNSVSSNIGSLVGILLLALIDVSVYSPLTSAIGIISGVVVSILFRERLGLLSYLAALIACVAVVI